MIVNSLREKICIDLLAEIAREDPTLNLQDLIDEFTLRDVLESSRQPVEYNEPDDITRNWTGLLAEKDIIRFGLPLRTEPSPLSIQRLEEKIDALIISISSFFHANTIDGVGELETIEKAMSISEDIQFQKHGIETRAFQVTAAYDRIETTIAKICESHTHLQESLSDALIRFPQDTNKRSLSLSDLLATTIETSLIKLSLMRARTHQALYDFKSPTNPQASMSGAVSSAYAALKKEERKLDEETRALNRQTEEYEAMLKLVDGGGGGFGQVVEDWTRVQKEKEECKRDLRRLGWTGD